MHLDLQLIHLLFTEGSSEMVSMEGWLSRSHSYWRETRRKDWAMPNDTRSELKISGNRSYGGMNPPQSPDFNITKAVWDHLDRAEQKAADIQRRALGCPSGSLKNYSWSLHKIVGKCTKDDSYIDFQAFWRSTNSILSLCTIFTFTFAHVLINRFTFTCFSSSI